jgi:hypothetical protein
VGTRVNGLPTIPSTNTNLNEYINVMFPYRIIDTFTHQKFAQALGFLSAELFGQMPYFESGLYFYLLIPIAALLVLFREKRAYFIMFWFAFLWLGLEFGPMHVGITTNPLGITYLLAYRLSRFMLTLSVPLAGILGIGLAKLLEPKNKILMVLGCIVLALILIVLYLNNYYTSKFWYYWQAYPNSLVEQAATYLKTVNPNSKIYLEAFYNKAYVGYSEGAIATFLGDPSSGRVDYDIDPTTNCTVFMNASYVIWAGPPKCDNWTNVLNITVPPYIPGYIVSSENPNMGYIITNVYYVK